MILAAMLLPALSKAKFAAKETSCLSNTRQLGLAAILAASDNDGYYLRRDLNPGPRHFTKAAAKEYERYIDPVTIGGCPVFGGTDAAASWSSNPYPSLANYAMYAGFVNASNSQRYHEPYNDTMVGKKYGAAKKVVPISLRDAYNDRPIVGDHTWFRGANANNNWIKIHAGGQLTAEGFAQFNPNSFSGESFPYYYQDGSGRILRSGKLVRWLRRNGGAPGDNTHYWNVRD